MATYGRKQQESGTQAQSMARGSGGASREPRSSEPRSSFEDLANRSARASQLKALQEQADGSPQVRQAMQLRDSMAHRPPGSEVIQRVTGAGLVSGLAAAGAAAYFGAPLLVAAGAGVVGASLSRWWRGAPQTPAPSSKKGLTTGQEETLSKFRTEAGIEPLDVGYDAALTDEVAGRRREKNAYRQWQIGSASEGTALGKDGKPLKAGRYMYVVTTGNEFRYLPMAQKSKEHFDQYRTHSQLAGKQEVYAAGAFDVGDKGEILKIDNESGHYRPGKVEHADYAKALLSNLGVNVEGTKTSAHDSTNDPKGLGWLMGQGKANLRALRTWLPQKSGTGYKHGLADPGPELEREMPF